MTTIITPGYIRLAVLNTLGGTKLKTLYLPQPDRGTPEFSWDVKKSDQDLIDGSERSRILGSIPVMTVKWTPYNDLAEYGHAIGTADTNKPSVEQLLALIASTASGFLKVSTGNGASPVGFVVGRVDIDKLSYKSNALVSLSLTFRGRDIVTDNTLGAF